MQIKQNVIDPVQYAKDAGLRYVSDMKPGIVRKRAGKGFRYVDVNSKPIKDPKTLARIKSLAIPPAWTNIWICPSPQGAVRIDPEPLCPATERRDTIGYYDDPGATA